MKSALLGFGIFCTCLGVMRTVWFVLDHMYVCVK